MRQPTVTISLVLLAVLASATTAFAHAVTLGDQGYIQEITGVNIIPFIYLGANTDAIHTGQSGPFMLRF